MEPEIISLIGGFPFMLGPLRQSSTVFIQPFFGRDPEGRVTYGAVT